MHQHNMTLTGANSGFNGVLNQNTLAAMNEANSNRRHNGPPGATRFRAGALHGKGEGDPVAAAPIGVRRRVQREGIPVNSDVSILACVGTRCGAAPNTTVQLLN